MRRHAIDKIDTGIISHLQQDGRRAFTSIAKDLGISEASVRQRVARQDRFVRTAKNTFGLIERDR